MNQRKIKFRAWDNDNKWMRSVKQIDLLSEDGYIVWLYDVLDEDIPEDSHNDELYMTHNVELMQYTGLKDKNGKGVYEGDIVRAYFGSKNWENKVVEYGGHYGDAGFGFGGERVNGKEWEPEYCWDQLNEEWFKGVYAAEVIGNIYQNPELLKDNDV